MSTSLLSVRGSEESSLTAFGRSLSLTDTWSRHGGSTCILISKYKIYWLAASFWSQGRCALPPGRLAGCEYVVVSVISSIVG